MCQRNATQLQIPVLTLKKKSAFTKQMCHEVRNTDEKSFPLIVHSYGKTNLPKKTMSSHDRPHSIVLGTLQLIEFTRLISRRYTCQRTISFTPPATIKSDLSPKINTKDEMSSTIPLFGLAQFQNDAYRLSREWSEM